MLAWNNHAHLGHLGPAPPFWGHGWAFGVSKSLFSHGGFQSFYRTIDRWAQSEKKLSCSSFVHIFHPIPPQWKSSCQAPPLGCKKQQGQHAVLELVLQYHRIAVHCVSRKYGWKSPGFLCVKVNGTNGYITLRDNILRLCKNGKHFLTCIISKFQTIFNNFNHLYKILTTHWLLF